VEGIYDDNGDGFQEVSKGYTSLGFETRMCVACTFDRLRIVGCPAHRYRKLITGPRGEGVDQDERVWDEDAWADALEASGLEGKISEGLLVEAKYCSVCPDLANYKCCAPSISFGEDGEKVVEGCGLWLCEKCMVLMGKGLAAGFDRGKESLDALVGEAASARLLYPVGVRADAEFITTDGELMMRIGQGMGADDDDVENEIVEETRVDSPVRKIDKGKGKDMSFFSPLPAPPRNSDLKGKGKERDLSYFNPKRETKTDQQSPHVWIGDLKGGGWMDDVVERREMKFGGEFDTGKGKWKAGKKGRSSTVWDKEKKVWGEVEVIELSSGDES